MFSSLVINEQTAPWYVNVWEILTYLPRKKKRKSCVSCFMALLKIFSNILKVLRSPMLRSCLTLSFNIYSFEKHKSLALKVKFGKSFQRDMYYLYAKKTSFYSLPEGKELNHW